MTLADDRLASSTDVRITETDIYLWAGVSQDLSPMHVDAKFAATGPAGGRIAHGNLCLILMALAARRGLGGLADGEALPMLDRVRFVRPVPLGATVEVGYEAVDDRPGVNGRAYVRGGSGELLALAETADFDTPREPGIHESAPGEPARADAVELSRTISFSDRAIFGFITRRAEEDLIFRPGAVPQLGDRTVPIEFVTGLMSAVSAHWCRLHDYKDAFSYGYDEMRLHGSVCIGDTLQARYWQLGSVTPDQKVRAHVEVRGGSGDLVATARHVLWLNRP